MRSARAVVGLDDEFTQSSIDAAAGADTYGLGPAESGWHVPARARRAAHVSGQRALDVDPARTLAMRG
jgi:hypothetical protein